jgi:nicotinic acid mononucleotide adenylyltransferase
VSRAAARAVKERLDASDRILEFELQPVDVSSSAIRARVARGEPIDGLVPSPVAHAIARLGLYRSAE